MSLLELMLVVGAIAAGTAIVYSVYDTVNAASDVRDESAHLRQVTRNILDSYVASEDFGALTTQSALAEGLFPEAMVAADQAEPTSVWGTPVRVLATDITRGAQVLPNWGFIVAYDDVPSASCMEFITNGGQDFLDIRVEGTSVGVGQNLDVASAGQLCERMGGADLQFIYQKASRKNPAGALNLCETSLPGAPETQVAGCPSGQYGLVNQIRNAFCTDPYGAYSWTPWTTVSQTCVACPAPQTRTNTQSPSCPSGQLGIWSQQRSEQRTANCPQPGPNGPTELTSWNAWTATSSWVDVTNTCAPICEVPNPSSELRWTAQSAPCPSGQAGTNTWEREERRTASCPAPTGAYSWTGWTATGATRNVVNTCATCPPSETRSPACPTGQVGAITESRSYTCSGAGGWSAWTETSNTCATCPGTETRAPACPSGQTGTWLQERTYNCQGTGSWNAWTTTTNTCTTCPPPQTQALSCPAGQYGSINQQRSYVCSGAGSWGTWTTTSNTCATCPAPSTQTQSQWVSTTGTCASGTWGNRTWEREQTQSRSVSYACPAGTTALPAPTYGAWSAWTNTGATRNLVDSCTNCPAQSTETQYRWTPFNQQNCPAGQYGWTSHERQQQSTRTASYTCPAGSTSLPPATYSPWGAWSDTATTRYVSESCTNCPASTTQTQYNWVAYTANNCPAGQYGWTNREKLQSSSRTESYNCPAGTSTLPAPTYTAWSAWSDTGSTRYVSSACTGCPPAFTQTQYNWVAYTANNCPAGQYGYTNREKEQTSSRTGSYACPAGTSALPAPNYTAWSAWSDTGSTRYVSSACANCPASAQEIQIRWIAYTSTCPAGQYGYTNWEWEEQSSRTRSYACPAGTTTIPGASYTAWSGWAATGAYRYVSSACSTCPGPQTETQTLGCPAFQNGSITQQRTRSFNCAAGTWGAYGGWTTTSNTCSLPACDGSVASNARNYMARYGDIANAFYNWWGQDYNQVYAHWYNSGYYEGRLSCWAAPCALPTPNPQTQTREYNELRQFACPAGQYGPNPGIDEWRTVYQSQSRTASCPAPTGSFTWGEWSAWTTTGASGWTRTANHCNNCPPAFGQTQYNWVAYTANNCPAGQYGYTNRELLQSSSRTGSYSCPAGTTAIPPASYTPWSPWANTGDTRYVSSACTNCPAAATEAQNRWEGTTFGINNCPAGQYGHNNYEHYQVSTRTRSYNCPAGSAALPAPSYTGWSPWANTGTYRYTGSSCVGCPAPFTQYNSEWLARSAGCASGQTGSHTWEEVGTQSRSVSYSCPAGSASAPAPTYGGWSGWTWTGNRRNEVNTCAYSSCTLTAATSRTWSAGGWTCSGAQQAGTWGHGGQATVADAPIGPTQGSSTWVCSNGTWIYSGGTCGQGSGTPGGGW